MKTVESRFSRVQCAPFRQVFEGDVILVKQAGGPVRAITKAAKISYFDFDRDCIDDVRSEYGKGIAADDAFWESQKTAQYATIIELVETASLNPFVFPKSDRRGWVPLNTRQLTFEF